MATLLRMLPAVALLAAPDALAGGEVGAASAVLQTARRPVEFAFQGPPFDPKRAKGATVYYFSADEGAPAARSRSSTLESILGRYGVRLKIVDAKGTGNIAFDAEGDDAQDASALVAVGFGDRYLTDRLAAEAQVVSIPFLKFLSSPFDHPEPFENPVQVTHPLRQMGAIAAAWVVADGGAPDETVTFTSKVLQPASFRLGVDLHEGFAQLGLPAQGWSSRDFPTWGPDEIALAFGSEVDRSHQRRYVVCVDGLLAGPMVDEATRRHDQDARVLAFHPSATTLEQIRKGTALKAAIGSPNRWIAYSMADQILRALTGNPAARDEAIPVRLFDRESLADLDPRAPEEQWYGTVDFAARYAAIWSGPDTGHPIARSVRPSPPNAPCTAFLQSGFEVVDEGKTSRYVAMWNSTIHTRAPFDRIPRCEKLGSQWHLATGFQTISTTGSVPFLSFLQEKGSARLVHALEECGVEFRKVDRVCAPCRRDVAHCPCSDRFIPMWVFCQEGTRR